LNEKIFYKSIRGKSNNGLRYKLTLELHIPAGKIVPKSGKRRIIMSVRGLTKLLFNRNTFGAVKKFLSGAAPTAGKTIGKALGIGAAATAAVVTSPIGLLGGISLLATSCDIDVSAVAHAEANVFLNIINEFKPEPPEPPQPTTCPTCPTELPTGEDIHHYEHYVTVPLPKEVMNKKNDILCKMLGKCSDNANGEYAKSLKYRSSYLYADVEENVIKEECTNNLLVSRCKNTITYGETSHTYNKKYETVKNGNLHTTYVNTGSQSYKDGQTVYTDSFQTVTRLVDGKYTEFIIVDNGKEIKYREFKPVQGDRLFYDLYDLNEQYMGTHDFNNISVTYEERWPDFREANPQELATIALTKPCQFTWQKLQELAAQYPAILTPQYMESIQDKFDENGNPKKDWTC
jgi:hypothetical protein